MVWEPFIIALVFGLLVSAALYFMLLWPGREPPDPADPADTAQGTDRTASKQQIAQEIARKIP
jgi:hypothetical protein